MTTRTHGRRHRATRTSRLARAWVLAVAVGCAAPTANRPSRTPAPLVIQEQGSFAVGGTVGGALSSAETRIVAITQ